MPLLLRDLEERSAGVDAGGIDQNVYAAKLEQNPVQRGTQVFLFCGIDLHSQCTAPQGPDGCGAGFSTREIVIEDGDIGAASCKAHGHLSGQDTASADNSGYLAGERKKIVIIHFGTHSLLYHECPRGLFLRVIYYLEIWYERRGRYKKSNRKSSNPVT